MLTEIIMPKFTNTQEDGQLVKLFKKEGEQVKKGEILMEIMTDKVVMEVEAPGTGVIRKIFIEEGYTVPIGTIIGIITEENEIIPKKYFDLINGKSCKEFKNIDKKISKESKIEENKRNTERESDKKVLRISPRAKKIAKEEDIDISLITPKDGLINENDVLEYVKMKNKNDNSCINKNKAIKDYKIEMWSNDVNEYSKIQFTGIRKLVAERLTHSKFTAPHVYMSTLIDMKTCKSFKQEINKKLKEKEIDLEVSYLNIFIYAIANALKKHRKINVSIFNNEIRSMKNINIGLAVDTEKGLLVPVVRGADEMKLLDIVKVLKDLISRTRDGKNLPEELKGGTFTISNLGMYDVDFFTSIINPPESAILGISKFYNKPIAIGDEILIRPIMRIILSFDHRVIDGALAAKFLSTIKEYLESPNFYKDLL